MMGRDRYQGKGAWKSRRMPKIPRPEEGDITTVGYEVRRRTQVGGIWETPSDLNAGNKKWMKKSSKNKNA